MPDREKIIRGLERCLICTTSAITSAEGEKAYRDCEYTVALYCRQDKLLRDVLTLLKEQKTKKPKTFTVIDVKTGEYPDLESIALHEEWAQGLVYCDMEGFAIEEDGTLLLMDECDNSRNCPIGRFEVVWDEQEGR